MLIILINISASFNSAFGQASVLGNSIGVNDYLGSSNAVDVKFKGAGNLYMTLLQSNGRLGIGTASPSYLLDVNGDVNVASGQAYYLNGNKLLWHRTSSTTTLFIGVGAGNTNAAAHNTFVGGDAGYNTSADGGFNTFFGYRAGYGNYGSLGVGGSYNTP